VLPLALVAGGGALLAPHALRAPVGGEVDGGVLVASNQVVTPAGTVQRVEGARPKDAALSPDGATLAVLAQNRVVFYDAATGEPRLPYVNTGAAGPLGLAWAPDGKAVYAALADGKVARLIGEDGRWKKDAEFAIDTVGPDGEPDVAAGYAGPRPGQERPAGERPCRVAGRDAPVRCPRHPQRHRYGVTAGGQGAAQHAGRGRALSRRTLAGWEASVRRQPRRGSANRRAARRRLRGTRVRIDPKTDAALRGSISVVDTEIGRVIAEIAAGRQPSGMAVSNDSRTVYVASSDDDTVLVLDAARGKVVRSLSLRPKEDPGFGQIPTDVALSADGKTLYVACGGANAVAVVDLAENEVEGWVPTGWYPVGVEARGGRLYVASSKGIGGATRAVRAPTTSTAASARSSSSAPTY
jgi:YVTN family beta-propeller protein